MFELMVMEADELAEERDRIEKNTAGGGSKRRMRRVS